ncbi:hypothetical protein FDP41_004154 [Naegleria fowleri]|uniref:GPI ethanolamine phosphate transferase 2 C-terminal domain-containing protein n=1 Tax=Naegleria fowleri TaxID=5763 RepID=A0A6A5BV99_NAEFO|nr:uncharacterized protein FDP41_004154 [Naegleria fowleri]KAF0976859.1 hypothetical protein FDP41_004154 [Naegleria fowleri]
MFKHSDVVIRSNITTTTNNTTTTSMTHTWHYSSSSLFLLAMIVMIVSAIYFFTFKGFLVSRMILPNSKYRNSLSRNDSFQKKSITSDESIVERSISSSNHEDSSLSSFTTLSKNDPSQTELSSKKNDPSQYSYSNRTYMNESNPFNIIILLIDALRFDFYDQLPFLSILKSKYPNHTRLFKFVADAPTTTSQRLKSLTTGSLPTFLEALYNFNSEQVIEDNLISQLKHFNSNIVVLGDDTWKYLFNTSVYFNTHYLYPSFNVWDLHTVDNGILEHLNSELESFQKSEYQRNVLIAHFLGVDHCGHRYGVHHSEMDLKLQQMNQMIEHVTRSIFRNDTMILIFGDHGMNDHGDHGGNSELEVDSLLFVYSPFQELFSSSFDSNNTITSNNNNHNNNRAESHIRTHIESTSTTTSTTTESTSTTFTTTFTSTFTTIPQIDLVPTLSLLLNIPIPFVNLGKIIPSMIPKRWIQNHPSLLLILLQENAHQIYRYIEEYLNLDHSFIEREKWKHLQILFRKANEQAAEASSSFNESFQNVYNESFQQQKSFNEAYKLYEQFIQEIVKQCRESWATFNHYYLYIGMGLLVGSWILLLFENFTQRMLNHHENTHNEMIENPFFLRRGLHVGVIGSSVLLFLFKLLIALQTEKDDSLTCSLNGIDSLWNSLSLDSIASLFSKLNVYYEMIHIHLCFFTLLVGIYEQLKYLMKKHQILVQQWKQLLSILPTWIDLICVIGYSMSLFSNSFIIYEDRMVNYLSIFRIILFYFLQLNYVKRKDYRRSTMKSMQRTTKSTLQNSTHTWNVIILLILLNQSSSMIRYRYHSSSFIDDNLTTIIFSNHFMMKLMYLLVIYYVLREHLKQRLNHDESSTCHSHTFTTFFILYIYLPLSFILVLSFYYFVNESLVEISNRVAQGLYALFVITVVYVGIRLVFKDYVKEEPSTTTSVNSTTNSKNLFFLYFFIISISPLLILYDHRYLYTFVILLAQYHYYYLITQAQRVTESLEVRSKESQIIDIFLFGVQAYFSLGHQNSMTTIHWNSAFVGISNAHMVFSGILVMLNQFSFKIILTITLNLWISHSPPLDRTTSLVTSRKELSFQSIQNYSRFLLLNVCLLVTSMLCAFIQRRHLMTWDIFAPKYMFDALSTLIVCACVSVMCAS